MLSFVLGGQDQL